MHINKLTMKTAIYSIFIVLGLSACASSPFGQKVKEPFRGSAYESNNRFFRATGKGESSSDNVARSKADVEATFMIGIRVNTDREAVGVQKPAPSLSDNLER